MQIQDVFAAYKSDLQQMEKYLDKYLTSEVRLIPEVAHHLIDSGGKRFRPLLLLISSRLCDYNGDHRFPMAAVMEFIHTASLLHDDVIDQAAIRRGKTSANNIWGNAASVLVGDFLYSKAFKLLSEISDIALIKLMSKITNVMSEGEVFQLMKCGDVNITEEEYLNIIEKKTAVLLSAACAAGAILGSAPQNKIDALYQFGYNIGMAFQITDDTLDYMAREQEFGKAIGKDLEEGKMTLPLIFALQSAAEEEKEQAQKLITGKQGNEKVIPLILSLINKYQGIDYSLQSAAKYIKEARALLPIFNDRPEINHLNAVAEYVLSRRI
ncbi:MAG: octaprenyl diphosphate synthase [Deltaproteobacteria bacterium HGW-Deltaproteobacteria-12]|jgi:octaprenyl-diphosphate synthase|nr:MAG: octaprenyl diphosphate synthase [Deltaproteobacteria bacterium HGW-Deltaproteobacteria-12]